MVGRRLHWVLKNNKGECLNWVICASLGVHLPLTAIHYENAALFETRKQARYIASKLPTGFGYYRAARVRVDLVEVL